METFKLSHLQWELIVWPPWQESFTKLQKELLQFSHNKK